MEKKRLLVLSVDAMVREDVDRLMKLHHFGTVMKNSCQITHARTIYPSITYPAHASISTGCYPNRTGIVSNFEMTTADKEQSWVWDHSHLKVKDIFTAAKKSGYSTGSVFWPVTGNHPDIDYLINEYWMPLPGDTLESSYRRAGSSAEVIKIIKKNEMYLPSSYKKTGRTNFMVQPYIDHFLIRCSCDIIRQFAPEVMFIHDGIIDGTRHKYGVFNAEVEKAIGFVDDQFGMLMEALDDAGVREQTNIVVLSDHGQMETKRIIKPNVYLRDNGFIDADEDGTVTDWRAFCLSDAMSDLVFLKDPSDRKTYDAVYKLLSHMADEGVYGFNAVLTADEIDKQEHLNGDFSFVLESDGYTSFSDSCIRPVVKSFDSSDYRFGRATHGYNPDLGPQPVFNAIGPDFNKDVIIERLPVVDEAPTLAKLLGVELPDADGTPIEAFLR